MITESEDYASDQELQERIRSCAVYFHKELEPIRVLFAKTNIPLDNRELRKQLNERLQALDDALWIKAVSYTHLDVYKRQVLKRTGVVMKGFPSLPKEVNTKVNW